MFTLINTKKWLDSSILGAFAICALAFCTNLGTALVSFTKLLLLIVYIYQLHLHGWVKLTGGHKDATATKLLILTAVAWMCLSSLWSIAAHVHLLKALYGHTRWLWLFPLLFLSRNTHGRRAAVRWLMYGQLMVVGLSLLLALGLPVPFTKHNLGDEFGVVFTYHLEQPVMSTVLLALLWNQREEWISRLSRPLFYITCLLIIVDVMLIVRGRTGYLMMLILLTLHAWRALPKRLRPLSVLVPVLLACSLYFNLPSFHAKVQEVVEQTIHFDRDSFNTSPGLRLDMWQRAIMGIEERPLIGHGVGSFSEVYKLEGGWSHEEWTNPHNQYLLWWNDAGIIGLILFLGIFACARYEARQAPLRARTALDDVLVIAMTMGLMNCPFYGVGTGEFFILLIVCLGFQRDDQPDNLASA